MAMNRAMQVGFAKAHIEWFRLIPRVWEQRLQELQAVITRYNFTCEELDTDPSELRGIEKGSEALLKLRL